MILLDVVRKIGLIFGVIVFFRMGFVVANYCSKILYKI